MSWGVHAYVNNFKRAMDTFQEAVDLEVRRVKVLEAQVATLKVQRDDLVRDLRDLRVSIEAAKAARREIIEEAAA